MRSSFRDSLMNSSADSVGERRTVIVERHNGSFGFTLQVICPTLYPKYKMITVDFKFIFRVMASTIAKKLTLKLLHTSITLIPMDMLIRLACDPVLYFVFVLPVIILNVHKQFFDSFNSLLGLRVSSDRFICSRNCYITLILPGDVIITINGQDVERTDHTTLVTIIQSCPDRIRMVVVFENW